MGPYRSTRQPSGSGWWGGWRRSTSSGRSTCSLGMQVRCGACSAAPASWCIEPLSSEPGTCWQRVDRRRSPAPSYSVSPSPSFLSCRHHACHVDRQPGAGRLGARLHPTSAASGAAPPWQRGVRPCSARPARSVYVSACRPARDGAAAGAPPVQHQGGSKPAGCTLASAAVGNGGEAGRGCCAFSNKQACVLLPAPISDDAPGNLNERPQPTNSSHSAPFSVPV